MIALDFEYRDTNESNYTIVCVAISEDEGETEAFWTYKDSKRTKDFVDFMKSKYGEVLISFNADAESKALWSLGIDALRYKWFDVQAEWKMITNHNTKFGYGKQLIDGKVIKTVPKDYYGPTKKGLRHDKCQKSLVACTFKLLGEIEDLSYKKEMIKLIVHNTEYTDTEKTKILEYCSGDIKNLFRLRSKLLTAYSKIGFIRRNPTKFRDEVFYRGESVVRAAKISMVGYPVDSEKLGMFMCRVPDMIEDCQEDINSQFESKPFVWKKSDARYTANLKVQKDWIETSGYKNRWERTPKGAFSLGIDCWTKFFNYRHDFPRENFPAQIIRYKKLVKELNGMRPKASTAKDKRIFTDFYGSDGRAHPYLNSYGAQSSRYQPHALGFLHLKSAWLRSLVEPKKGRVIIGIDYKSQEFLLAALMSNDKNMINAYKSGDVYLYFAKLAKAVPWSGERKDYESIRNRFKSTTLGISYLMSAPSLALKLTNDTGEYHSEDDAEELIHLFEKNFSRYHKYREQIVTDYHRRGYIQLSDGWTMFGDNDNDRSVANMPIQGMGGCILRKAIKLCQKAGLDVILPLHDALYIEVDYSTWKDSVDLFTDLMIEAFSSFFPKGALKVGVDINAWGKDLENGYITTKKGNPCKTQDIYIDGRAKVEYNYFKKYFDRESFYECL